MKRLWFLVLFGLCALGLQAQIRVDLTFDDEQYLQGEECLAKVVIQNSSGQSLSFGKNNEWLQFNIAGKDGSLVRVRKPLEVDGEFALPSAHRATKVVDLAEFFELDRFGRFVVSAVVRVPEWNQVFESRPKSIDISKGVKLWEQAFGIPNLAGGKPEIRKYMLTQSNRLKQLNLYVRITDDAEGYTFKIFPLGGMLSFSRPEPQLDQWSNLHVLYQDTARGFRYCVVTPDGLMLSRQTWLYDGDSRPILGVLEGGRVGVKGGTRQTSASDLPPPELLSEKVADAPAAAVPEVAPKSDESKPGKP